MKFISKHPSELIVGIKSAGEMATGIAVRLYQSNIQHIFMMETKKPLAVRRTVSFCEAIHNENQMVEGVEAVDAIDANQVTQAWQNNQIAVIADPDWKMIQTLQPDVIIDAVIAKKNLGTTMTEAPLVIGLGPGFEAKTDVHLVIETNRGHNLGRVMDKGCAHPNTGIPGSIGGYSKERVLRAPCNGIFESDLDIGAMVNLGHEIGSVDGQAVFAQISGVLRGLIKPGNRVKKGLKLGDVDPRGNLDYCDTVSDKARALGGSVLEAILSRTAPKASRFSQSLGLNGKGVVSLIGAGGKTSLMFKLAHELAVSGKTVLTTTTTKIFMPGKKQSSKIILSEDTQSHHFNNLVKALTDALQNQSHVSVGESFDQKTGKVIGLSPETIDMLWQTRLFDVIIVEADGAKQKPIKASASHEPVIPKSTTHLIHLTGLDAVGAPIDSEHVHRPEILIKNLNLSQNQTLTESNIAASITHEINKADGLIHPIVNTVVLNKADSVQHYRKGQKILKLLQSNSHIHKMVITAVKDTNPVK